MSKRPGGQLATRPLHFIWIADASGSMRDDGKIQALNMAIREAIPHMQKVASENPNAQVLVRAIKFSSGAQWHISQPTPVEDFKWVDLKADGVTDMGKALSMVADQLKIPPMTDRALPPVLVLISDGQPTDSFEKGLQKLMDEPWGKKAVRIAIAIGKDADHAVLQKFIGHNEIKPLQANNPEALVNYIKWVSTAVLKSASSPASQAAAATPAGATTPPPIPVAAPSATPGAAATPAAQPVTVPAASNIPIPAVPPPLDDSNITADDVW
ncbi:MAG: VWA domain-containing protein [Anaerolineae bacterium]